MEHFGGPDDATQARIQRRFAAYLREGADDHELTGEYSYHDGAFGDSSRHIEALIEASRAAESGASSASDLEPAPASSSATPAWIIAGVAVVALVILGVSQYKMVQRLEALDQNVAALEGQTSELVADEPVALEPGKRINLEHLSWVETSKDAKAKLLRSDVKGARFELESGSLSVNAKPVEGVEWLVRVGEHEVLAIDRPSRDSKSSTWFHVTRTKDLPTVEVIQGKVRVSGGKLGDEGVIVTANLGSLAAAMAAGAQPEAGATAGTEDSGGGDDGDDGDDEVGEDLAEVSSKELFTRAVALRETNEAEAETMLWVLVERGEADLITEKAFEQLRSLVPADARLGLSLTYAERFPEGAHVEDFAAMGCRATPEPERASCWKAFRADYPDSLYGP